MDYFIFLHRLVQKRVHEQKIMLNFSSIPDLTEETTVWKIKVRIVRAWGFQKPDDRGVFTGLNLLLVDEKGDRIQAFIKRNLIEKYEKYLQEGVCRTIMNFELLPNRGTYRGSSHPFKINFLYTTYVKDCEDIPNLPMRFNFTKFTDILAASHDENVFLDVIGEIVDMGEIKEFNSRGGRPSKILKIQLRDLGGSVIDATLWDHFGEDILSYAKINSSGPIILLGSLMKINLFQGDMSIQTSMFATKLLTDPAIPEISEFKKKMAKSSNKEVNLHISQSKSTKPAKEIFSLSDRKTIAQMSELTKGSIGNVLATISSIQTEIPWCYIGCVTCSTKVTPYFNYLTETAEPGKYSCDKCKRDQVTTVTMFKTQVRGVDHSCSASFLLFDSSLTPLLHKSATDLIEQHLEFKRPSDTPQELLALEGREFVFKVKHADSFVYKGSAPYNVIVLTSDPEIVSKFEESSSSLSFGDSEIRHGPNMAATAIDQIENTSYHSDNKDSSHNSNVQLSTTTGEDTNNEVIQSSGDQMATPKNKRTIDVVADDEFEQSSTKPKTGQKPLTKKVRE